MRQGEHWEGGPSLHLHVSPSPYQFRGRAVHSVCTDFKSGIRFGTVPESLTVSHLRRVRMLKKSNVEN